MGTNGAWSSQVISAEQVIITPASVSGLFVYTGTELIASISSQNGEDPVYGETYLAGFTTYINDAGTYYAVQYGAESINFLQAPSPTGSYTSLCGISFTLAPGWLLAFGNGYLGSITAIQPGTPATPETFHYLNPAGGAAPAFNTDWSNMGAPNTLMGFQKLADSDRCVLEGAVSIAAGAGSAMFSLPAGYKPASNHSFVGWDFTSGAATQWTVETSGAVVIGTPASAGHNHWVKTDFGLSN